MWGCVFSIWTISLAACMRPLNSLNRFSSWTWGEGEDIYNRRRVVFRVYERPVSGWLVSLARGLTSLAGGDSPSWYRKELPSGWEMSPVQFEQSITLISACGLALYQHWLSVRMSEASSRPVPVKGAEKLPGRNDPCQCGSGKKFKKCCLHWQSGRGLAHGQWTIWVSFPVVHGKCSLVRRLQQQNGSGEITLAFFLSENGNELFFHKNEISRNYTPADNTRCCSGRYR